MSSEQGVPRLLSLIAKQTQHAHQPPPGILRPITLVLGLTVAFVIIRLVGSISTRLLGIRPPLWRSVIAVYLGATAGSAFAVKVGAPHLSGVGARLVFFGSMLAGSMLFTVLLELIALSLSPAAAQQRGVAVPNPVRAVRHFFARWSRYLQITGIVARYGLLPYLTGRRTSPATDASGDISSTRRLWSRISQALAEAGGVFVKLGQVLSTRADLLPADAIAELSGLQDKVPPAPRDAIAALLARELGAAPEAVFASFDATPLAAASIAQVHAAQLVSGEQVIVKVQRPGIREPVERDLDILLRMARGLEARAAWARAFGAADLAEGFAVNLREELDFRVEARNIGAVAASLNTPHHHGAADVPASDEVYTPGVFPQHSTSRVLVIERLDGVSVRDAGPFIAELGLSRPALARALLRCFLRQILREGTFHADPHPGNIMVLRDGHLALIDFGSVGRLDPLQQAAIKRLLVAMDRHDAALFSDALLDLAQVRMGHVDEERLERSLAQLMAQRLGPGMSPGPELFADLFAVLLDFGLAFPPVIGGVFRALVTLQGTLALLDPDFQPMDEARDLGAEWMHESFAPTSLRKAATDELLALLPFLQRLPRRLDRITAALERGQLSANVRLLSDDRDVCVVSRLVSRGVLAFLGVGLSIPSVLLLGLHGGPTLASTITAYQLFGYVGLFTSAVLILRVIVAIARERVG
jgi:ubiquinone biosynthesis protein